MDRLIIGVWQGRCKDGDLAANIARTAEVIDEAGLTAGAASEFSEGAGNISGAVQCMLDGNY